jgi:hypothetical protein
MLNQNTLTTALALAERLESSRMAVYPVSGSPLEALVNSTRSDPALLDSAGGDMAVFIAKVGAMANKVQEVYGTSHHNATIDQIAQLTIKAVRDHLAFAKTVVAPTINDLYTRVQASLADVNASVLLGMEVEVLAEPAPLENTQFQNSLRKFDGISLEDLPLTLNLPDQTYDELRALVATGASQVDSAVAEWLATDDGILPYIWSHVFQQKPVNNPKGFQALITDRQYGVTNALAIYLLARKLTDSKPLQGTQMSLGGYKQQIVDFRNQAGAALCRAIDRIERSIKNGVLVRDVVDGVKSVVYEPLYRKFLEEGGSNEILFGNALTGRGYLVTMKDLLANKGEFAERWNLHVGLTRTAESNKRFNKTKDFIELHFNAQLAEIAATEEGTANNIQHVRQLFEEVMRTVKSSDLDDLYTLCLKVVCRARYYKTDAERILLGIEQAKRDNPNLSVREAAMLSALNYTADWVSSMMRVVAI